MANVDVVNANFPFLIGLDLFHKYKIFNNVENILGFPELRPIVRLVERQVIHIYIGIMKANLLPAGHLHVWPICRSCTLL